MAHVLETFEAWMDAQGIQRSDAIKLVAAAAGCSGLALGVQVRLPGTAIAAALGPHPTLPTPQLFG